MQISKELSVLHLIVLLLIGTPIYAGRILMVPAQWKSHVKPFVIVADDLIKQGHDVYIALTSTMPLPPFLKESQIKIISWKPKERDYYQMEEEEDFEFVTEILEERYEDHIWMHRSDLHTLPDRILCKNAYADTKFLQEVRNLNIDLALIDGFQCSRCFYPLLYRFDIPYITVITGGEPWVPRGSSHPSFVPNVYTSFTENMSFVERLKNVITDIIWTLPIFSSVDDSFVKEYAPDKPFKTLNELYLLSRMWFLCGHDPAIDYPRPSMPYAINVAGLNTAIAKPLESDLQKFMQSAKNGVIVITFGSIIGILPKYYVSLLDHLFQSIPYHVIFRYPYPGNFTEVPGRLKVLEWIPQNDLLGHPKTKLFITHCGNNGQMEALMQGVPMIGLPVFADQIYNCKRIEYKQLGICMDMRFLTADDLIKSINNVMTDKSYAMNMEKASAIFKQRTLNPRETAVYWVEHVLKFGSEHLRSIILEMPWYKYYMIDILCLFVSLCIFVFTLLKWCSKFVFNILIKYKNPSKKKTN